MDKNNFITFKQAKELCKLGYPQVGYTTALYVNGKVLSCYKTTITRQLDKGDIIIPNIKTFPDEPFYDGISKKELACPTIFEVEQWLRKKFNIHIFLFPSRRDNNSNEVYYKYQGFLIPNDKTMTPVNGLNDEFKTKEDALKYAIDKIFEYIKETKWLKTQKKKKENHSLSGQEVKDN